MLAAPTFIVAAGPFFGGPTLFVLAAAFFFFVGPFLFFLVGGIVLVDAMRVVVFVFAMVFVGFRAGDTPRIIGCKFSVVDEF